MRNAEGKGEKKESDAAENAITTIPTKQKMRRKGSCKEILIEKYFLIGKNKNPIVKVLADMNFSLTGVCRGTVILLIAF